MDSCCFCIPSILTAMGCILQWKIVMKFGVSFGWLQRFNWLMLLALLITASISKVNAARKPLCYWEWCKVYYLLSMYISHHIYMRNTSKGLLFQCCYREVQIHMICSWEVRRYYLVPSEFMIHSCWLNEPDFMISVSFYCDMKNDHFNVL